MHKRGGNYTIMNGKMVHDSKFFFFFFPPTRVLLKITFDNAELTSHRATTNEIKECCRDIKVLGRKELR